MEQQLGRPPEVQGCVSYSREKKVDSPRLGGNKQARPQPELCWVGVRGQLMGMQKSQRKPMRMGYILLIQ